MNKYPALALIEFSKIGTGILSGDTMVKSAPISVIKSGTVHNGKYLIMIQGSVASVEEAYLQGLRVGENDVIDKVFLPNIHSQVLDAIKGKRQQCKQESLGIIEVLSVASIILATDYAIKTTNTNLIEIRLADDIGGKAFAIFNGKIEEVQEAISISKNKIGEQVWIKDTLIPNIHFEMVKQLDKTTIFKNNEFISLSDKEI